MTTTVMGLVVAYIALAVLLMSLNLQSAWRWPVKVIAVVLTTGLYALTYQSVIGMMGWPADQKLPKNFQLHWGTVNEPDKFLGTAGNVFLWVEEIDAQNYPVGTPRAFKLPYSKELAEMVMKARANIEAGHQQAGTAEEVAEAQEQAEQESQDVQMAGQRNEDDPGGSERDPDALLNRQNVLEFHDLPPPELERKPTF